MLASSRRQADGPRRRQEIRSLLEWDHRSVQRTLSGPDHKLLSKYQGSWLKIVKLLRISCVLTMSVSKSKWFDHVDFYQTSILGCPHRKFRLDLCDYR
jgi:hypothetical protein